MNHASLQDFLSFLADRGHLHRIRPSLDATWEVTEILRQCEAKTGGTPALLCESIRGSDFPLVVNVLGSRDRMAWSLGADSWSTLLERLEIADTTPRAEAPPSGGWLSSMFEGKPRELIKKVKIAPCQQVVRLGKDIDLSRWPFPKLWSNDTVPTIGLVRVTAGGSDGRMMCESVVATVHDGQSILCHWPRRSAIRRRVMEARAAGQQVPLAIAIGEWPSSLVAERLVRVNRSQPMDAARLRETLAILRSEAVEIVRCRSSELDASAQCEAVFEGYIDAAESWIDGPAYMDLTGIVIPGESVPIIHLTAITHRSNPVIPLIVPGLREAGLLESLIEVRALHELRGLIPGLMSLRLPVWGGPGHAVLASIAKQDAFAGRQAVHAILAHPEFEAVRLVIVVDDDVPLDQPADLLNRLAYHPRPDADLVNDRGLPSFWSQAGLTSQSVHRAESNRLGIDATRKWPAEGVPVLPTHATIPQTVVEDVRRRWADYGFQIL